MDRFLQNITTEVRSLTGSGRTSEAIYALEQTISWALVQLALIWGDNCADLRKAESYLRTAIKVNPASWAFYVNLAHVLNLGFKFEEAKRAAMTALSLDGHSYETYYNLGVILSNMEDHEGAIAAYKNANSAFASGYNLAAYNIASSYLTLGRWQEGWEAYETRFAAFEKIKMIHDRFPVHYKRGDKTKGKTIYVYNEQGVGDLIQFSRYLPKLKSSTGAKIILESQKSIADLLAKNFNLSGVVAREDEVWPIPEGVDYAVSICSLPGLFDAGTKAIPNKPYIKSPGRDVPDVLDSTGKLKVGLCWAGNASHTNDFRRSIRLKMFEPLFDADVKLYSFQKDAAASRNWGGKTVNLLADCGQIPVLDISPCFRDFSDTAYYLDQMDLVITVDTSIAHLAGAMGKTTWLLVDKLNDWRWLLNVEKSEWYPSMRIFRQERLFEWEPVVARVVKELIAFRSQRPDQNQSPACDKRGSSKSHSRKRSR